MTQTSGETRLRPVPFTDVRITDEFWRPRLQVNSETTVWYDFQQCEKTGRIDNFTIAGRLQEGDFEGLCYNDSDVYKVIEGAAYTLAIAPDPTLDAYLDRLIAKIAAAQEDDGYLYTIRTIRGRDVRCDAAGPQRWSNLVDSHELYNVGHLYEAAVAHHLATGKRTLLDIATRSADLVCSEFGPNPGQRRDVPGHQEIEIGLMRLYGVTGNAHYLELARFFLDQRGRGEARKLYGPHCQDHKPVIEQDEAVGHAVRAAYMYSAMTDIAAICRDTRYAAATQRLWEDVVCRKMYITGGIGARRSGEAFGEAYELPNATAYNETCAAIAHAMWNQRMFLLHGDARYIDVLERVLYNGFLAGVAFSGDRFFYPNPLAWDGHGRFNHGVAGRAPWFRCSCCPVNVVRFIPSIAGYVYATRGNVVYVNLYIAGTADVALHDSTVHLTQQTRYPWDGRVHIGIEAPTPTRLQLRLRIPGWARGEPVPGDLYRYLDPRPADISLRVNGATLPIELDRGYALIDREWRSGDTVDLDLPMPVRRTLAHPLIAENTGRVALERGPIVYCFEGTDNDGRVQDLALPDHAPLQAEFNAGLLNGVAVIRAPAARVSDMPDGTTRRVMTSATAIPYHAWAHRGQAPMEVWIKRLWQDDQP